MLIARQIRNVRWRSLAVNCAGVVQLNRRFAVLWPMALASSVRRRRRIPWLICCPAADASR